MWSGEWGVCGSLGSLGSVETGECGECGECRECGEWGVWGVGSVRSLGSLGSVETGECGECGECRECGEWGVWGVGSVRSLGSLGSVETGECGDLQPTFGCLDANLGRSLHPTPCPTVECPHTMPHSTVSPRLAPQYSVTTLCPKLSKMHCIAVQNSLVQYARVQFSLVKCYTDQFNAMIFSSVQWSSVQCTTIQLTVKKQALNDLKGNFLLVCKTDYSEYPFVLYFWESLQYLELFLREHPVPHLNPLTPIVVSKY